MTATTARPRCTYGPHNHRLKSTAEECYAKSGRLRWSTDRTGTQRSAYDQATGLGFVITRIDSGTGPRGGRLFEYEIETSERGARIRLDYVQRLDTAKALAQTALDNRRTGADA